MSGKPVLLSIWLLNGSLTRAVCQGGVCYLDEVVEARADKTVAIHALTDHRREVYVERLGEAIKAPDNFMLIISYNSGYESILKDLKPSTRQRMVSIELDFLPTDLKTEIIQRESGIAPDHASDLVRLANAILQLDVPGLSEVSSTRSLIAAADLMGQGFPPREAVHAGMISPLCDDSSVISSLMEVVTTYID